jgi:hypothetical protein
MTCVIPGVFNITHAGIRRWSGRQYGRQQFRGLLRFTAETPPFHFLLFRLPFGKNAPAVILAV